jgi:four helix bundle protein
MEAESRAHGFRELNVWQLAMDVAAQIYQLTAIFPKHELYGLASQMQRAAVSVPSNIAEGNKRESTKEYLHHISIAAGSLAELETQLLLSAKLNYAGSLPVENLLSSFGELGKMLSGLRRSLRAKL